MLIPQLEWKFCSNAKEGQVKVQNVNRELMKEGCY